MKMTIYDKIKYLREKQGLSQQELAEKVGFKTASAVNKIELGLRDINQTKILAFAKALGTTPNYLLSDNSDIDSTLNEKQPTPKDELGEDMVVVHRNGKRLVYHITDNNLDSILPLLETLEAKSDPDL